MEAVIVSLLTLGYELRIYKEFAGQCKVEVSYRDEEYDLWHKVEQLIPMDHHIAQLPRVIEYCMARILKLKKDARKSK